MKHEKYKELLELNILNELTDKEQIEMENHLLECSECSSEYSQLKKMYSVLTKEAPELPTDNDLLNARTRLFNSINNEIEEPNFIEKLKKLLESIFPKQYSIAFGGLTLILVGFFVGYLIFNTSQSEPNLFTENVIDLDKIDKGEVQISKVNLPQIFSEKGEYEFKIGDEKPVIYKGTLNDEIVQKLLAAAFKETDNPGFKIQTAKSIKEFMPKGFNPDAKIKEAFIHSLKTDENPGVRKGALQALINFPYDDKIRDALLYTLDNDENASNRIDAINALLAMNLGSQLINDSIKTKLEKDITNEENEVVKFRTAKLLLGGK
ncbi:MAG: HEAT repeat domain-containing protein [Ignavibacteriae bacterium]|nr:HEAT repeat domain-containing protein [Ignavibacteriota bacterium]MCB9258233.1 HEAT repeat domain-containing protein [Ignavibacteriales bacterium]